MLIGLNYLLGDVSRQYTTGSGGKNEKQEIK